MAFPADSLLVGQQSDSNYKYPCASVGREEYNNNNRPKPPGTQYSIFDETPLVLPANPTSRGKLQGRNYKMDTNLKIAFGVASAAVVAGLAASLVFGIAGTKLNWFEKIVKIGLSTSLMGLGVGALGLVGTTIFHFTTLEQKKHKNEPIELNVAPF